MSIQHCAQCNKYLPRWDKHQRCARHRGCTRLLPCPICRDWPEGIWLKLQTWFESHPQPPASRGKAFSRRHSYGMSQGSLSDSVLMAYPQGQASSSSEPEALDLYPSSSDSGAEGSRDWLPRDDPRRIRTATREPKSAVGRAPRKGSTATGPLEPVGSAPDQFLAAPNPVSTSAATRESLSVVGCAPRMDSISAGPYNPVGDAPGTFSAATTPLGNIRAPLAATRESRSVVGCAPRMDSPLAGTHNPVGCAAGSNSAAQAYGVGSPRDLTVLRQGPNACASSYPQPAAGETWQAGDNALSQPPLPRAVGNAPQGILAVDNVLPAPVPTGQRAARDFAQPASRAREIFPGDATGARDFAQPASRAREIFLGMLRVPGLMSPQPGDAPRQACLWSPYWAPLGKLPFPVSTIQAYFPPVPPAVSGGEDQWRIPGRLSIGSRPSLLYPNHRGFPVRPWEMKAPKPRGPAATGRCHDGVFPAGPTPGPYGLRPQFQRRGGA